MNFLSSILDHALNFFFPRDKRSVEIEAMPLNEMVDKLPRAENLVVKDVIAIFDYKHPMTKEVVWEVKYRGNTQVARKLGGILHDTILEELSDLGLFDSSEWHGKVVLIPMPISRQRRFKRGWNQSEYLAKALVEYDDSDRFEYLPKLLAKTRHTESQTSTNSKSERLKNVKDSMSLSEDRDLSGRCAIIIDDVTTTGATFEEARRALKGSGVKKVLCIAVAH